MKNMNFALLVLMTLIILLPSTLPSNASAQNSSDTESSSEPYELDKKSSDFISAYVSEIQQESKNSSDLQIRISVLTIAASASGVIAGIFIQQRWNQRVMVRRSKKSIMQEIKENHMLLLPLEISKTLWSQIPKKIQDELLEIEKESGDKSEIVRYAKKDQTHIDFSNMYFDTSAFDSVVSAGYFVYFEDEIRRDISTLYGRIKKQNQVRDYLVALQDDFFSNGDESKSRTDLFFDIACYHHEFLTKLQTDIVRIFVGLEKNLT